MAKWRNANCYGYAVKENDWLLPPSSYADVAALEKAHPELKRVRRQDMQLGKKYIAYRYSMGDFHFMRRDEKGHWRHKPGSLYVRPISTKEVFASVWLSGPHAYSSKIYLYEVL